MPFRSGREKKQQEIRNLAEEAYNEADTQGYKVNVKNKNYNRANFAQLIMDNIAYLAHEKPNYISNAEFALIIKLASITQKFSNLVVKVEKKSNYGYKLLSEPATITWLANFFNYSSRSYLNKKIIDLEEKGVLFRDKDPTSVNKIYINPELTYRGNKNKIFSKLCDKLGNKFDDVLDKEKIALPWKVLKKPKERTGKLYKRSSYMEEKDYKAKDIEEKNKKLEESLDNIAKSENENSLAKFIDNIYEQRDNIYDKLEEMGTIQFYEDEIHEKNNLRKAIRYINGTADLKDSIVKFIEKLINQYSLLEESRRVNFLDFIKEFLEDMHYYAYSKLNKRKIGGDMAEEDKKQSKNIHKKFLLHEIFLYLIMLLVSKSRHELIYRFLHSDFILKDNYKSNPARFSAFSYGYSASALPLMNFNLNSNQNHFSIEAEKYRERVNAVHRTRSLPEIDLLVYYLSFIYDQDDCFEKWFPRIYISMAQEKLDTEEIKELNVLQSEDRFVRYRSLFSQINRDRAMSTIDECSNISQRAASMTKE